MSIALCSRFLHSLVELRLKPVCEILGVDTESQTHQTPSQLLCTLLSNPSRAAYIGTLRCFKDAYLGLGIDMEDYAKNIQDAVKKCPDIYPIDSRRWCAALLRGERDCTIAFLLTILPNLQNLHLWNTASGKFCLGTLPMIQAIVKRRNREQGSQKRDGDALARLTSASVEDTGQTLWALASIPSMRNLRVQYVNSTWSRRLPSCSEARTLSLENVDILNCSAEEPDLLRFLRKLKHLRRFHFETSEMEDDSGNSIRLFRHMCATLLQAAGSTLERLKLKDNRHPSDSREKLITRSRSSPFGGLKEFQQLRTMEINEMLITGRLVDILPKSVEQVVLLKNDRCRWRDPSALFKDLPMHKTERWPCLSSITYDCPFPGSQERTYEDLSVASGEVQDETLV